MKTNREKALQLLDKMTNAGISESMILDYLLNDFMSGAEAMESMISAEKEFFQNADDFHSERDLDSSSFDEED